MTKRVVTKTDALAVLLADVHFSLSNLELATKAFQAASARADSLNVPLVIAGDLTDGKAIIRGEVANRLLELVKNRPEKQRVIILVGNHDMINEKGATNSLNFLRAYAEVVHAPAKLAGMAFIPYSSLPTNIGETLAKLGNDSPVIMHQGVATAFMGAYVQDKTSLPKEIFSDYRVISGHYHRAQDIKCGKPRRGAIGLFSYVGSPFTHSFSEAGDGPKGFQILKTDGSLELVPLNLRKHIIVERTVADVLLPIDNFNLSDVVWLKVTGSLSELDKLKKQEIGKKLFGHSNFKLDKISAESAENILKEERPLTGAEILDKMIEDLGETQAQKTFLKKLWREAADEATKR